MRVKRIMSKESEISSRLSYLRKTHNLSQEDLAQKLNISRQAVSNWERGKSEPDMSTILQLSDIYSINIDELLKNNTACDVNINNSANNKKAENYSALLFAFNFICTVLFTVYALLINNTEYSISGFILSCVFLAMATTIYFTFGNIIKNSDYSLLAGYDKNLKYNKAKLKQMLISIESFFLLNSFITNALSFAVTLANLPQWIRVLLLFVFIINFLIYIVMINIKYQDEIIEYDSPIEKTNSKKTLLVVTCLAMMIIISVIVLCVTTAYFEIENNSAEMMSPILILLVNTAFNIIALCVESAKSTKSSKNNEQYAVSKMFFITVVINIISWVLLFAVNL